MGWCSRRGCSGGCSGRGACSRKKRAWLIATASVRSFSLTPVFPTLSEPARSTCTSISNTPALTQLPHQIQLGLPDHCAARQVRLDLDLEHAMRTAAHHQSTVCPSLLSYREEAIFIGVSAIVLLVSPRNSRFSASSSDDAAIRDKFCNTPHPLPQHSASTCKWNSPSSSSITRTRGNCSSVQDASSSPRCSKSYLRPLPSAPALHPHPSPLTTEPLP